MQIFTVSTKISSNNLYHSDVDITKWLQEQAIYLLLYQKDCAIAEKIIEWLFKKNSFIGIEQSRLKCKNCTNGLLLQNIQKAKEKIYVLSF